MNAIGVFAEYIVIDCEKSTGLTYNFKLYNSELLSTFSKLFQYLAYAYDIKSIEKLPEDINISSAEVFRFHTPHKRDPRLRREIFIAAAMLLAFSVIFGYGFYPDSTAQMAIVDNGIAPDNGYAIASDTAIWTERTDYLPGEIVPIYGTGFLSDSVIEVNVTRPNSDVETDYTMSDEIGDFVYYYDLDGIYGQYNVTASDGEITVETSFLDGAEVLLGYSLPKGEWKESNLAPQKDYVECDWVPYQLSITDASPAWNDITRGFVAGQSLDIGWPFLSSSKDAIFVDMLGEFYYQFDVGLIPDKDPGSIVPFDLGFDTTTHSGWTKFTPDKLNRPGEVNSATGLYDEREESCNELVYDHFIRFTPDVGDFPSADNFTLAGHHSITIYFQAHLSLDALWRNGQEAELPTELAGTLYLGPDGLKGTGDDWVCPHHGSSFAPGASENFKIHHKTAGAKTVSIPIAAYPTGTIEGYKWNDINGNGVHDTGEPGIPDWGIDGSAEIEFMPGLVLTFTLEHLTTDGTGYYSYTGIIEGNYTIDEEDRDGWAHSGVAVGAVLTDWNPITGEAYLDIDTAGSIIRLDFLNTQFGEISGYKWHDLNGDGVWDLDTEPALDGWTIELRNATTNAIIATAVTGAGDYDDGYYDFTHVLPGDYLLTEVLTSGWINTASPSAFTLSPGDDLKDKDFGNFELCTISGYKFEDVNYNGEWDDGEEGLYDWSIHLVGTDVITGLAVDRWTTTNGAGYYEFTGLTAGDYVLSEVVKAGWIQTGPATVTIPVSLTYSGQVAGDNSFFNFELIDLSGYKWHDLDGDGVWDVGEPGLVEWTIILDGNEICDPEDPTTYIRMTTTASDGSYSFLDVTPAEIAGALTLYIYEVEQAGWTKTYGGYSAPGTSGQAVVGDYGMTEDGNFGNFKWFTVSGHKYLDYDGYDESWPTDRPLNGWTIELWMWDGHDYCPEGSSVTTGPSLDHPGWDDGYYELVVKYAGLYQIREVLQSYWTETRPEAHLIPNTEDICVPGYYSEDIPVISGHDQTDYDIWNMLVTTWMTDTSNARNIITDFRIVFTPDIQNCDQDGFKYKISSTNPGGFYFNLMYHIGTDSQTVTYDLPDGFGTQGGNPIHAYVWNDLNNDHSWYKEDGSIDWSELSGVSHKITVDLETSTIIVEDVGICNNTLITIHVTFTEKGTDDLLKEEAEAYVGEYPFSATVDEDPSDGVVWYSETALTAKIKPIKEPKSPCVYGVTFDSTLEDTPIAGITISLYDSKGHRVDSFTSDEYGFYMFDKLKAGTYTLKIEIPLYVLVEGLEDTTLVLRLTMEMKLSTGDYIQVSLFIEGDSTTIVGPPGLVLSEEIGPPSSLSSTPSNTREFFHPGKDVEGNENIYQTEASISSFNLGIPILAIWFAAVSIFAYLFDSRRRKKTARTASVVVSSKSSLEWLLEDSDSKEDTTL